MHQIVIIMVFVKKYKKLGQIFVFFCLPAECSPFVSKSLISPSNSSRALLLFPKGSQGNHETGT